MTGSSLTQVFVTNLSEIWVGFTRSENPLPVSGKKSIPGDARFKKAPDPQTYHAVGAHTAITKKRFCMVINADDIRQ